MFLQRENDWNEWVEKTKTILMKKNKIRLDQKKIGLGIINKKGE